MLSQPLPAAPASAEPITDAGGFPLVKLLRLALEFFRATLVLWLLFPRLERDDKLRQIQRWAKNVLLILEVEVQCDGPLPAPCAGLMVANHLSWLDILVLQSLLPGVFVAKAEVRRWPLVGWMAQACATIFVERSSRQSARRMIESALAALQQGYPVIAFPEGTSSDGSDLAHFHANIFESAIKAHSHVQPVTLKYLDSATGRPSEAALFTGDMTLVASLRTVMAQPGIKTRVQFGERIPTRGQNRKSLALQAHRIIRAQLTGQRPGLASDS
ncbi:MAG: lysophospholipid acyltransferase family protein [Rhodoferax sp.]|uniref:lysophospholipid acyltransferase family protein n=1 Tax=Rhodoferax sp. TaxID=50421 RepID=UPI002636D2EB|nr:lysophospholipid acyltransferase family protein [Rhodoferax sp.]MDD5336341.1 lysophospholipid acyltransferase family protein [Rhodoferax sp.]